ncbi:hypothetical protein FRC10_002067 [Ceratobasidium sp. 414]|nr:hypothetical protein FRC10_002067 [Ceratobasidium sp. 414]
MRIPTPASDEFPAFAPVPPGFSDVASSLATAADSLSKAAHAMATAAQAMSEASRVFGALNSPIPDAVAIRNEGNDRGGESVGEPPERESEDDLIEIGSDSCPSEISSSDVIIYESDEDDLDIPTKTPSINPVIVPNDPTTTEPCSCGSMDISQIQLNPYPPPQPQRSLSSAPSAATGKEGGGNSDPSKAESQNGVSDIKSSTLLVSSRSNAEAAKNNIPTALAAPPKKWISAANPNTSKLNIPTSTVHLPIQPLSLQQSVAAHPKLPYGRNYIQLEEDFDAIPIISCMALASNRTICLVPSSESLSAYKKIVCDPRSNFNAITNLEVEEQEIEGLVTATPSSILLLPFESLPHILPHTASADCVIHWGWPENLQTYLKFITLMKLRTRSCLILPTGDHLKPRKDSMPSDYAVVKYPTTVLNSYFGPKSPIHEIRRKTIDVLTEADAETVKILYHSWLDYYGASPARRVDWTISNLIDHARKYASKALLRGSPNDGSKVYPPISRQRLPLPDWVIEEAASSEPDPLLSSKVPTHKPEAEVKALCYGCCPSSSPGSPEETPIPVIPTPVLADHEAKMMCCPTSEQLVSSLEAPVPQAKPCVPPSPKQPVHPETSKAAVPSSLPCKQPTPPTPKTTPPQTLPEQLAEDRSKTRRYYFVLEEEFDAIPLISYLGLNYQKTVCYVPSPESMKIYQSIFQSITELTVISPATMSDATQAQAQLASASQATMLVQFYWALHSSVLQQSTADASICWGIPTDLETYVNGAAKNVAHSYLLLSTKEYNDPLVRMGLARLEVNKHPSNDSINDSSSDSLLAPMRRKTMAHFKPAEFSATAKTLYYVREYS